LRLAAVYGGYMMNWIERMPDRFKCIVQHDACSMRAHGLRKRE
jgi:hypothetical protein